MAGSCLSCRTLNYRVIDSGELVILTKCRQSSQYRREVVKNVKFIFQWAEHYKRPWPLFDADHDCGITRVYIVRSP